MQTKRTSALEAGCNVTIGYVISVAAGQIAYPLFGLNVTLAENAGLTLVFMAIGFIRAYLIRRYFTRKGNGRT